MYVWHDHENKDYRSRLLFETLLSDYCCTSGYLGLSDLRRVQNTLWEARTQWYNLGLDLDIGPDSLDSIELANSGKPDRCFRAMLTKWLREHHRPTWSALAEALRSPSVGLSHLAEDIIH